MENTQINSQKQTLKSIGHPNQYTDVPTAPFLSIFLWNAEPAPPPPFPQPVSKTPPTAKTAIKRETGNSNQPAETRKPTYPSLLPGECWFILRKALSQYNHYQTRNSSVCPLSNARERSASRSVRRGGGENAREGDVGSDFSQPPPQLRP